MVTCFWSVKGGVGVSTVAALQSLAIAGRAEPTMLIDLVGDQPALLGIDEPSGPGISEWLADGARDPEALERIATPVNADLVVVHRGSGRPTWPSDTAAAADQRHQLGARLAEALATRHHQVVVDCGLARSWPSADLLAATPRRFLVLRPCYLGLRAARSLEPSPVGVIAVREPGRALGLADIEAVTDCPVVADLACDTAIARAVDAGLLASRMPRGVRRLFEQLAEEPIR